MNQRSPLRWLKAAALGSALTVALSFAADATVRVALMDAICDDNSYRSTLGAIDFTAALQAEMSGDKKFEWVERAELAKAEAEFKLGGLGLIDRFEAIRGGRWVKADWAVFGRISTNSASGRTLGLEIVDLERADVLAATNLVLAVPGDGPFKMSAMVLPRAASDLNVLLNLAERTRARASARTAVALLFLSRSGSGTGLAGFEADFRDALTGGVTNGQAFHLIQFQRASAAMDEANLVLSGLAQTDLNAWEKLADHYIWGNYAVRHRRILNPQTRQWQEEKSLEATLSVWDGRTDPRAVTLSVTNIASDEVVARDLAAQVASLLSRSTVKPQTDGVRRRISQSLVAHAVEMARARPDLWFGKSEGQQKWLEVVQVLETACFFDPGNMSARELWARVRWGQRPAFASGNEFFFARRRCQAWQKYVEQFGFQSACPVAVSGWWETNSAASEYVLSAWRPFEMFNYSQTDQAAWGVPRDAGGKELLGWRRQFAEELLSRLLTAPDDPRFLARSRDFFYGALSMSGKVFVVRDAQQRKRVIEKLWPIIMEQQRAQPVQFDGAYRYNLKIHFQELGQPGGDEALLAPFEEIARAQAEAPKARTVKLPRAADIDSPERPTTNP